MTDQTTEVVDLAPSRGWVTGAVLARMLGIHVRTVQRLTATNDLPFTVMHLGREYRYPLAQVNRYLVELGVEPYSDADVEALKAQMDLERPNARRGRPPRTDIAAKAAAALRAS